MTAKYRPHRELFKEACDEMVYINSLQELKEHLTNKVFSEFVTEDPDWKEYRKKEIERLNTLSFIDPVFDKREPWNDWQYYVTVKNERGHDVIIGMCSKDLNEIEIRSE